MAHAPAAKVGSPPLVLVDMNGPELSLVRLLIAAMQCPQSGHWRTTQNFGFVIDHNEPTFAVCYA